jgi:NAD+ synthase (glutamine-hydrolysing)
MAKAQGVNLLCLPELCITGYGCEDMFLAPWVAQQAMHLLIHEIAPHCRDISVIVGLPVWHNGQLFDCVACVKDCTIEGFYAKQFLALDGLHYEPRWFKPWPQYNIEQTAIGETVVPIGDLLFEINGIKIAVELCEEAWRGEERTAIKHAKCGAKLIVNPSASHYAFSKTHEREKLLRDAASFFEGIYIYVNLLGNEAGRVIYEGETLISSNGRIVARNNHFSFQDVVLTTYTHSDSEPVLDIKFKENKHHAFRQAQALGLFDYMRKSKSKGFALSLSGGADSACCAVLVCEMVREGIKQLGEIAFRQKSGLSDILPTHYTKSWMQKILATAYQSTDNSGEITRQAAAAVAQETGATHYEWDVQQSINHALNTISAATGKTMNWQNHDLALQNIQSRMRASYIWLLANLQHALLLTTSNRSEGDVGYATMDGDTSGGLAPIAGVDKHFVRQWLVWAEQYLGYTSLQYINSQAPTAELRPPEAGQTDEKDLMPYAVLVQIEREAIFYRKSPQEVFASLQSKLLAEDQLLKIYINRFFTMWSRNQWKRERLAPSFHLDDFNIDPRSWFRFPILSGGFALEIKKLNQPT